MGWCVYKEGMSARRFQLHNHFQLPCIFNDLLGQFCRRNSCFFCFLLLGAERVVSIRTLSPTSLQDKHKSKGEEGGKLQKYIKVTNENAEKKKTTVTVLNGTFLLIQECSNYSPGGDCGRLSLKKAAMNQIITC